MLQIEEKLQWFVEARYGLFIHFGLYSLLGRGEWVMNRERIEPAEYSKLADRFNPVNFNADEICQLAVDGGMKYIVFTTMHHDGFRMYDSDLSDFCSTKTAAGRDFVAEIIAAARVRGLKIGLYHSLNNLYDRPDGVDALEDDGKYRTFIENTFVRLKELLTRYSPVDILWYDGWWPFHADGWQAEKMNAMARSVQPGIIVNGRNGLPGDFATPEQHLSAPSPWRPWEACITLNDHWCHHPGDNNWKTPSGVVRTLVTCTRSRGNLLLNVGLDGTGRIPEKNLEIIRKVGSWIKNEGTEALAADDIFSFDPTVLKTGDRGDWDSNAQFSASGNNLYASFIYPPENEWSLTGLECRVINVSRNGQILPFSSSGDRLAVKLPPEFEKEFCPVLKIECDNPPVIYRHGGMRRLQTGNVRYDPCPPDIRYT